MARKRVIWALIVGACAVVGACEPEKLDRGKEMAVEAERHKVKRITQEDMEAWVQAAGDTVVSQIEGAFLQLAESQPKEQELFVAQPEKLPLVQSILRRYKARLTRKTFSSETDAQQTLGQDIRAAAGGTLPSTTTFSVPEQEFLFQRPIQIRRRNCASCEEPSVLDFTGKSLDQLRVFSAQGKPGGFEVGQVRGVWQIYFPRAKVIEQITLKTKVSRRGRFFSSKPDSVSSSK
ncbi:hypothetical protein [Rufibacter quisquiliarum]|uniref:DUF3365 domain-containing protein n=1 Tax=Rufibacter quisquiliarum TaxID=1549639 RepID=A0A839GAG8_9BACT|nr:hypothetical protein [Rufibacter quisquiliarum]MBA9075922.1 hypothetical protein [Rufibacter quisquiliarum]